jgi:nitrite reductase (NADH) large subunit
VLAGEKTVDDIMLNTRAWYGQHGIDLLAGDPVGAIDRPRRLVRSASGKEVRYDRLLLATGSKPFIIPVPGHTLDGVIAFRDIQDVETMLHAARNHRHAVVIGGGLLGLEAANGLMRQGMDVTVVHLADSLMDRQLDKPAAELLKAALERKGLRFLLSAQTAEISAGPRHRRAVQGRHADPGRPGGDDRRRAPQHRTGRQRRAALRARHRRRRHAADLRPRIYAVGECVQHRQATFGLVAPIWDQARVCAAHLAGAGHRRYVQQATATKLKVTGVDLYSAGDFIGGEGSEDLVLRDPRRGVYKRLVLQGGRLVGAVLYGDVKDGPWYFDLIQTGQPVAALRQRLLFGKAQCEALAA